MKIRISSITAWFLVALTLLAATASCRRSKKKDNLFFMDEFPLKSMPAVKGNNLALADVKDGRVHLFYFFTSHCAKCIDKLFLFNDLRKKLPEDEFAFHLVYFPDEAESAMEAAKREADSLPLDFQILVDADRWLAPQLLIKKFPGISVFNKEGKLVSPPIGDITKPIQKLFSFEEFLDMTAKGEIDEEFWLKKTICHLVGRETPDSSFPNSMGRSHGTRDYVGKKILIIVFWSPSCTHCIKELPMLNSFYIDQRDQLNFEVISMVSAPPPVYQDIVEASMEIAKDNHIVFPVLFDSQGIAWTEFYLEYTPSMLFVGTDGILKDCIVGEFPDFEKTMRETLSKIE